MANPTPRQEPEMSPFETRLRGLRPAASGLDRDRLLFDAGRASRLPALWPAASLLACAALVAACLAWWSEYTQHMAVQQTLIALQTPQTRPPAHELDAPPAPLQMVQAAPDSYIALRQILDGDLDSAIKSTSPDVSSPHTPATPSRPLRSGDSRIDL